MKKRIFGTSFVAAMLMIGAAHAAPPSPPPIAPPFGWTGPYAGIAGGYGWGHSNQHDNGIPCEFFNTCEIEVVVLEDGSYPIRGGLVGGTVGYNSQWGQWVLGLETDFSWADINGSSNTCGLISNMPHSCGTKLDFLGTLRGRVGYAVGPNGAWLPYVTGGLAYGQVKAWDNLFPANGSDYRAGWTLGGGIEMLFARNWSFKVEYLYVDLGSQNMFNVVPGIPESVSVKTNIIRAGINYQSR